MRWLFVGEALVLRKEQRILVFIVLIHAGSALQRLQRPVGILGEYAPECVALGKRNA